MRAIVFVDGQNLFHLARRAWSDSDSEASSRYAWPSYDVEKLANAVVLANEAADQTDHRLIL
jgi:hypothetical protein